MALDKKRRFAFKELQPSTIVVLSFFFLIGMGTFFLMLPFSTVEGKISLIDALFVATSATCVTGLVLFDTGSYFTIWGQLVILLLIQAGGLGLMTFSTFFLNLLTKKISIRDRLLIQESLTQFPFRDFRGFLKSIFLYTFLIEAVGALVLMVAWFNLASPWRVFYLAVFHSISAFCNAGFSLFEDNLFSFRQDPLVLLIFSTLIVLGGLGFVVAWNVERLVKPPPGGGKKRRLSFHSKVVLITTFGLLLLGTVVFWSLEHSNSLKEFSFPLGLLNAFFQSVVPRTAGFNSMDISQLKAATLFFIVFLMFVGASPCSTGGGVKTTTFALFLAHGLSKLRGKEEVEMFSRRVLKEVVQRALVIMTLAFLVVNFVTFLLLVSESEVASNINGHGSFLVLLFETASAFGTVGLSMGVTSFLSPLARLLLVFTMFAGRVGPLTLGLVLLQRRTLRKYYPPKENLLVG